MDSSEYEIIPILKILETPEKDVIVELNRPPVQDSAVDKDIFFLIK